jgi:hypothetical protein
MRRLFATASILALLAACVGGPGQLPGEDGQQSLQPGGSGTGSGSGSGGASGSSSVGASTPPGRPNVDPPIAFDAGTSVPKDSGTTPPKDSGPVACTNTGQTSLFEPASCQTCLEQQCCTQLKSCFTLTAPATKLNCNQYNDCLSECVNAADPNGCQAECNATAQTGVTTAYSNIVSCAQSKCLTPCQ